MSDVQTPQSNSPVQIALTKWSSVWTAISAANEMYNLGIDQNNYENRVAYRADDGFLQIDLVNVQTGELEWVFRDRYSSNNTIEEMGIVENPKDFGLKEVIDNFSVLINDASELSFLSDLRKDVAFNSGNNIGSAATMLANLLNNYGIGPGWSSNPGGTTTAYFVLRYIGPGADAPEVYNFNRNASHMVVLELMMHGEYKTHALIVG